MVKKRGRSAAFMRSINPYLRGKRAVKKRSTNVVRKSGRRRGRRSFFRRSRGSSSGGKMNWLAALAYGAIRSPVANRVTPTVASLGIIPADLADEAGMGAISFAAQKYGSGMIKDMGKAGLVIETARLAESFLGSRMSSSSATSSGMLW